VNKLNESGTYCEIGSSLIKSWKRVDEEPLITVVEDLVSRYIDRGLILDLLVGSEAQMVEERLDSLETVLCRRRPSRRVLHRSARKLGIYTQESTLSAAVRLQKGADVKNILQGDVLWSVDFILYPDPGKNLGCFPDPHLNRREFVEQIDWSLAQETGSSAWILTAQVKKELDGLVAAVVASFARVGGDVSVFG